MNIDRYYRAATLRRKASAANTTTAPSYTDIGVFQIFIQPRGGGAERAQFDAVNEDYTHVGFTAVSTPAQYGDLWIQDGVTYRVVGATQPRGIASRIHHKELQLRYSDG